MSSNHETPDADLQQSAERIRSLRKSATAHAIEIGCELLRVKARLPHGAFVKWVEAECEFKIRMAQDLMKLAREVDQKPELAAIMTPSALRIYQSGRAVAAVRDLVSTRTSEGRTVSRNALRSAIAAARTATMGEPNAVQSGVAPRSPAGSDLLAAGAMGGDTELDRSGRVAELLLARLSRSDLERLMDGMTWGVWNRVLIWLRADLNGTPVRNADGPARVRAA